jgi:adenylate cyclase
VTTPPSTTPNKPAAASTAPQGLGPGRRPPRRRRLTLALAAGTALLSGALAWLLSITPLVQLLELKTYDLRFVLRGKESPPPNIILVTIDDRTERAIPEPRVFWHRHYATLLRAAAAGGARAIGLDVSFAMSVEKWEPDADRELAAAFSEVSASVPIVLAYDSLQPRQEGLPLYLLATAQGAMGFANLTLDRDNFVRRQELQSRDPGAWGSFVSRLAAVTLHVERGIPDTQHHIVRFGSSAVPLDPSGFLLIHYWGPDGTFPAVSMADVLAAGQGDRAQLERWFGGKIVLAGTLDPADKHPTPFYLAAGSQRLMSGVEIHANVLGTLLEQRFLRETPRAVTPFLVFGAAALAAYLIFQIRFPLAPLLLLGVLSLYLAVTALGLRNGMVFPVTPPVMSLVLSGFASYGAYSLTEGRQRRLLQEVFGRYVSGEVAQELLDYGEIPLGGTQQIVTVMFTDLRNYTKHCQGRDSSIVVAELNEYFADMTAEIKAHGGMVNKFIGDGIMALFGAPVPHPDDARRAVACALHMLVRNEEFNRRRAENGLEPLVIGVALHTGEVVVGNIGAPQKMEYTAIGDTVNVASRIEGENKTYHSRLLISEATYQCVRDDVTAELAGRANLKGISEPVAVYKILELEGGNTCSIGQQ